MKDTSIKKLLNDAKTILSDYSATPSLDAELLLCHLLKKNRIYLYSHPEKNLSDQEYQHWQELLEKRLQQIPIAYLTGQKYFWNLDLHVNEYTLIPRPETELLVELVLSSCRGEWHSPSCLDLGTGSGAIALAIAKEKPQWRITAVDISLEALKIAQKNANKNNIDNVMFIQSNWFSSLSNKFEIIVSNPPYIDANDPHLLREEIRYEPRGALVANNNGFADIENIIAKARNYLQSNGQLFVEHGYEQGARVRDLFAHYGYQSIKTFQDLAGLERITCGIVSFSTF